MTRPQSIGLVDLSALFKARYHGGRPEEAALNVLSDLAALRATVEHVILCLDAPPYKRKEVFPEYKAHRPPPDAQEKEQRRRLYERCKQLGYQMAKCEGFEGDDVIATLARVYGETCAQVLIIGSDKDLAQCVTENVLQFVPGSGDRATELRGPNEVKAKYHVAPEQIPLFLALWGDKGDNIPGVPGVGQVKASALASEFKTLQGLKDGLVYRNSPNVPAKIWQNIEGNGDQVALGVQLTTLNDRLPLDAEALLVSRSAFDAADEQTERQFADRGDHDPLERAKLVGDITSPADTDPNGARSIADFHARQLAEQQEYVFEQALADFEPEPPSQAQLQPQPPPANDTRGKVQDAEFTEEKKASPPPQPQQPVAPTAIVKAPQDYGLVTHDLQPLDLRAARNLSTYLFEGGMYATKFKTALAIFTVILRARELGIGITTALANMHNLEGTIVMSADLIRAQCEKSPDFEYLMPVEMSRTSCTWEGKNKRQPRPVKFTYTVDDAKDAGLLNRKIWRERQQDMLNKTAGSKLARILFPGAVAGVYCPEEMAVDTEGVEVAA